MSKRLKNYKSLGCKVWPRAGSPRQSDADLLQEILRARRELIDVSDGQLTQRVDDLRAECLVGNDIFSHKILVPMFGLACEALRRTVGFSFYDEQILAGLVLSTGAISEMATGEGKTLVVALPAALHALNGKGVHVATVNAYLARRDFELLRPLFEILGFSVGLVDDQGSAEQKRHAYACDITYATGYQLGFDYLHDQITLQKNHEVQLGETYLRRLRYGDDQGPSIIQRGHAFAIIDEIDSVLIDEATTPLILSGTPHRHDNHAAVFHQARQQATMLEVDRHYVIDEQAKQALLTEHGKHRIYENPEAIPNDGLARPWANYIEQALRANHFLRCDVDYIIRDGKVVLVDQNTGRIFEERTWSDGLHQAVEANEDLEITDERCAIARISRQRYFRMYDKLCGMTGTAAGNEAEFFSFYGMPVVKIPLRRPCRRVELPPQYFQDQDAKFDAVAREVAQRHAVRQPVLIGTRTIRQSLQVSERLTAAGLPHRLLNGVQDEDEASLVATSGEAAAITIATNMAGRGTDIKPSREALEAGGLHVVATEYHESARIDRQLIGRAARQGETGSCQFLCAADDELITRFDPRLGRRIRHATESRDTADHDFSKAIRTVQARCERRDYEQRCQLLRQEKWLEDVLATLAKDD